MGVKNAGFDQFEFRAVDKNLVWESEMSHLIVFFVGGPIRHIKMGGRMLASDSDGVRF